MSGEALSVLTGFPVDSFSIATGGASREDEVEQAGHVKWTSTQEVWLQLESCSLAGYLLAASCTQDPEADAGRHAKMGIVVNHAYSFLQTATLPPDLGGLRMVQLRNPWGQKGWLGAWSVTDKVRWTPQARQALGFYANSAEEVCFKPQL